MRRLFVAAARAWQRRRARGLGIADAETGAVCFTQRFDSLLRANPNFHALFPDAVFVQNEGGRVEPRVLPKRTREDVESVVKRIARRARKLLGKVGEEMEQEKALDRLRGRQLELLARPPVELPAGRLSARAGGFSPQAANHVHANDRAGFESLVRYALRPPMADSRLSQRDDGELVLKLKRPLADGRESLTLNPMALMRSLVGLVPRPRIHQTHCRGAFAAHAGMRGKVVPRCPRRTSWCSCSDEESAPGQLDLPLVPRPVLAAMPFVGEASELVKAPAPRQRALKWSSLLARTFGDAILNCRCGGRRRIVAFLQEPARAAEIPERPGVGAEEPRLARTRSPPQAELFEPSPEYAADPAYPDD